jgi:hypothetical protein
MKKISVCPIESGKTSRRGSEMSVSATSQFESKTALKTFGVTFACLLGAAYSSLLLYQNLHSLGARDGTPMAKVQRVGRMVRLKPAQSFVWSNIGAHENLYLKDSIQTPAGGGASLLFNDGTKLDIGENSLIIIDSIQNLSLNFLRGSVVVRTQAGDSKVTVGKDGKTQTESLAAHLVSPEPLSQYFIPEKTLMTVDFTWEMNSSTGQSEADTLEISKSPSFHDSHRQSLPIAKRLKTLAAKVPEGEFYWRILSQLKPISEPSRFRVNAVAPLKPIYPAANQKIPTFGNDLALPFRWARLREEVAAEQGEEITHRIEFSTDPQFTKILEKREIAADSGTTSFKGIHEGQYYWRILSEYPGLTLRSPAERFQVEKVSHAAVDLNNPTDGSILDMNKELRFSWSTDAPNVQYRWQVRSVASPDKIQSTETKLKAQPWRSPAAGDYQWRVETVYSGQVVGESAWRGFSVLDGKPLVLREPSSGKEIRYWVKPTPFEFTWDKQANASSYILEVSTTSDFKNAKTAATQEFGSSSTALSMTPGEQFWRVKAVNAAHEILNVSSTGRFTYGPYPLLRAPASAQPDSGSVINPLETEKNLIISWSPVENAESYVLTVTLDNHVLLEKNLKETQTELNNLAAGKYQYTVQAIDHGKRKGEALPTRLFTISFGNPLKAPEALSPEVQ